MNVTAPPPLPAVPLLSPEQLQQLAAARIAGRKVRRAISVATFDGWTIAVFAGLTFICGLSSVAGVLMGLGMGAIAFVELHSAGRLRRMQPAAAMALGYNQLALAGALIVYALWSIHAEMSGHGALAAAVAASDPELIRMLGPVEALSRQIAWLVYGGLIAAAVFAQGSLALYYFTRQKYVWAYVRDTPAWILQMQQAGVSV